MREAILRDVSAVDFAHGDLADDEERPRPGELAFDDSILNALEDWFAMLANGFAAFFGILASQYLLESWQEIRQRLIFAADRLMSRGERRAHAERCGISDFL